MIDHTDKWMGMFSGALGMFFSGLLIWQVNFKWREQTLDANALVWHRLLVSLSTCDFMQGLYYVIHFFGVGTSNATHASAACVAYSIFGMYFACASFFFYGKY
jgi:hypothetical protein